MRVSPMVLAALAAPVAALAQAPPLKLDGMVRSAMSITADQLRSLPPKQVDVTFQTMHGDDHHVWTGVLVWDLVNKAGLKDEPGRKTGMRHVLLIHGSDGYAASLAIGEIDPAIEGKAVIVAYAETGPGDAMKGLQLIVPGDRHGARDVHDVVEIEVR